jgi:hypothetical protein
MARKAARRESKRKPGAALGAEAAELVSRLSQRTGLTAREVIERALAAYAAAVAPGMPLLPRAPATKPLPRGRLFVSVDGQPEIEIARQEFILGRDPSCDVALDLPLISPRHARVLWKEGQPVLEDLRSARGTWRNGERIDVQPIADGDEFDLAGFLPVRFRLAGTGM